MEMKFYKYHNRRNAIVRRNIEKITTSNHMFKREIWDKFTNFTFLKF